MIPDGEYLRIRHDDGREERYRRDNYEEIKHLELGYLESVQNMVKNVAPSMHEVIQMTSENPAKYIGVFDRKGSRGIGISRLAQAGRVLERRRKYAKVKYYYGIRSGQRQDAGFDRNLDAKEGSFSFKENYFFW